MIISSAKQEANAIYRLIGRYGQPRLDRWNSRASTNQLDARGTKKHL